MGKAAGGRKREVPGGRTAAGGVVQRKRRMPRPEHGTPEGTDPEPPAGW
jgi:hypothetical protein